MGLPPFRIPPIDPTQGDPGINPNLGPSGMQQLQSIMQMLSKMQPGGPTENMSVGGGGTPARTPGAPPAPALPLPPGSAASMVPQLSQQPMPQSPSVGSRMAGAPMPAQQSGYQFATPKARNAAVVTNAIQSFGQLANSIHQKKFEEQVAAAEQVWSKYLTLTKQYETAKQSGDKDQMQSAQQQLQEYMQDKAVQKVLQTVSDPKKAMSPTSIGVQRAIAQSKQQAMQDAAIEEAKMKALHEYEASQQERAHAELYQRQMEQEGQVTPALQAQLGSKEKIAEKVAEAHREQTKAYAQAQSDRTKAIVEAARIHASAIKDTKGPKDLLSALKNDADTVTKQLTDVQKREKDLQDNLNKSSWQMYTAAGNETRNKIAALAQERQQLQTKLQSIQRRYDSLASLGAIQPPEPPTPGDVPPPSGNIDDDIVKALGGSQQ